MEYRHTCSGSGGGGGGGGGLARIDVTPNPGTVAADKTLQFTATGYSSNNTPVPITPTWTSTDGTITTSGLYTPGGALGTWDVEAAVGNIVGKAKVTVTAGALASLSVTPGSATITADQTQKFSATGADSKGNSVPVNPSWTTTGGAVDGSGLYTPDKVGTFQVTATEGAARDTATVTVGPGQAVALTVDPPTATVAADSKVTFKALATDAKGNAVSVSATWSVSGGAEAGVISPAGVYDPMKVGSYTVTAASGSLTATAQVEVTPGKVAILDLTPKTKTVNVGETIAFTFEASDSDGNPLSNLVPEWDVTGGIGTVTDGVFTAKRAGSGKVTLTVKDGTVTKEATATVTVKDNPYAAIGLSSLYDLLFIVIGLVVLLVAIGVIVSLVRKRKRKDNLQSWMQGYDGQPYPEQQQLQQWMQTYEGQAPPYDQNQPGRPPGY
jgi:hypothetical protein